MRRSWRARAPELDQPRDCSRTGNDRLIGIGLRWIEQMSRSRRESRQSNERRAQALENGRAVATATLGFNMSDVGRLSETRTGELLPGSFYRHWPDADAAARTRRGARRVADDALNAIAHMGRGGNRPVVDVSQCDKGQSPGCSQLASCAANGGCRQGHSSQGRSRRPRQGRGIERRRRRDRWPHPYDWELES